MSWNLEIVGTKETCQNAVDKEENIPSFVKTYIREAIEVCAKVAVRFANIRDGQKFAVHVRTFGHVDDMNFQNDTLVRHIRIE